MIRIKKKNLMILLLTLVLLIIANVCVADDPFLEWKLMRLGNTRWA